MGTRKVEAFQGDGGCTNTARGPYLMAQGDIRTLLRFIAEETKMHAAYAKKSGLHFGHVGDLGAVRRSLVEVLAQLAQQDEQFVWKRLADARETRK